VCCLVYIIQNGDLIKEGRINWQQMLTLDITIFQQARQNRVTRHFKTIVNEELLQMFTLWYISLPVLKHPFSGIFPRPPRWAGTRKVQVWILLKKETVSGSGISWAICKFAHCSRRITTPAHHHSVFYRPDALPAAQPTASNIYTYIEKRFFTSMPFCHPTNSAESQTQ